VFAVQLTDTLTIRQTDGHSPSADAMGTWWAGQNDRISKRRNGGALCRNVTPGKQGEVKLSTSGTGEKRSLREGNPAVLRVRFRLRKISQANNLQGCGE
jgi:hypothetical protein